MAQRDSALHLAAGAVIGALAIFGIGREMLQHDPVLTLHQWIEALAWPAGGLVAVFLGWPLLRYILGKEEE